MAEKQIKDYTLIDSVQPDDEFLIHDKSTATTKKTTKAQLDATLDLHKADVANPHAVTKSQVNLGNVTDDAQLKIASNLSDVANPATARGNISAALDTDVSSHVGDVANPHTVTKAQVALGNVTDDAQLKVTSNLSDVGDAATARGNISAALDTDVSSHVGDVANPHAVTKSQVGLGNVTDDVQLKRSAGDYSAISEKTEPNNNDYLLIEDSEDSDTKKKVKIENIRNHYVGEMYVHLGSTSLVVGNTSEPVAVRHEFQVGLINGFSFEAGSGGAITAFADAGSGKVTVTSNGHGLVNGRIVTIKGTTNYNGLFVISGVTTNTFDIVDTWVADDATGTWDKGANLIAGDDISGYYLAHAIVVGNPSSLNKEYHWHIYVNDTIYHSTHMQNYFTSATNPAAVPCSGILALSPGDVISLVIEPLTDSTNFTHRDVSVNIK